MKELKKRMKEHFDQLVEDGFIPVNTIVFPEDKDELYEKYQDSFRPEDNKIFRERREYDCSECGRFIKNIGGVVFIKETKRVSIWDFDALGTIFDPVTKALTEYINERSIEKAYLNDSNKVGLDHNLESTESNVIKWQHLYLELPNDFVAHGHTIPTTLSKFDSNVAVFKRGLEELTIDSLKTVLELIDQNSLYKGEEWKRSINAFIKYKEKFDTLNSEEKEVFVWYNGVKFDNPVIKLRNTSIGTLLIDISDGLELDEAVSKYEKIVAPENYKRPKAIFTKKMVEDAEKKIKELDLESALQRRFAVDTDINVNDILFVDRSIENNLIGSGSIFDELKETVSQKPKTFNKVQEVGIDKFISDILPNSTSIEAYVEGRHIKNLVSLIAPVNDDVKPLFKWNNNFTWSYNGNITDSSIKSNVKKAGGNVEGYLRFSLQWNDEKDFETDDLDAHCKITGTKSRSSHHIYYSNKSDVGGRLDVDIMQPDRDVPAVENIYWSESNKNKLLNKKLRFFVNNYMRRSGTKGFKAQLEINGEIHDFIYDQELRDEENVDVVTVEFGSSLDDVTIKISENINSSSVSVEEWGIKTNEFIPVSLVTLSPNHWGEEKGIGNKHFMFMLKNCINDTEPNGFYNEFLISDLIPHRKVFEALGSKLRVKNSDNQLSGLGFSSTQSNDLIVKVKGETERILKIKF